MADLLFVTWDGGGNVPPALGIAGELARRGHRTRFLGHRAQQHAVIAAGHDFVPYTEAADFVGSEPASPARMLRLFADRAMGRDLLREVGRRPADVVVVDALLMGVLDAAAGAGLAYVPLQHLFLGYQRGSWVKGPMGLWGRVRGLRPVARWDQAPLSLAATLPELDPAGSGPARSRLPANVRFTGPVVEHPDARPTFSDPTVLVSLSTVSYPRMERLLQTVIDATEPLDARVVVTTGPAVDPAGLRPHDRVELHRYVPHAELMPGASLVVAHGGHATAMRALAHDLPLLVLPLHPLLDHRAVGRAVEGAGAGRTLPPSTSPEALRPVIAELLGDGPHRAGAAKVGARIRAARGAETAADAVEGLLTGAAGSVEPSPNRAPRPPTW